MTNPMKGEIEIELGGNTYNCRLTIDSLIKIETALGVGILKTAQRMAEGDVNISDVVNILTPSIRGGGNDLTQKDVMKIISDAGIVRSTVVAAELLASTISDNPVGEEEAKKQEVET